MAITKFMMGNVCSISPNNRNIKGQLKINFNGIASNTTLVENKYIVDKE